MNIFMHVNMNIKINMKIDMDFDMDTDTDKNSDVGIGIDTFHIPTVEQSKNKCIMYTSHVV
jgi:hypothetical protein